MFASRPILEVRAPTRGRDAALDAMPEVEKTSIFGTAVHAVLRSAATTAARSTPARLAARASPPTSCGSWSRRSRTCSSTSRERRRRDRDLEDARRRAQGVPPDRRDRRTLLILLFVPAFFLLLYGYALNFDIRNVALAVAGQRSQRTRAAS